MYIEMCLGTLSIVFDAFLIMRNGAWHYKNVFLTIVSIAPCRNLASYLPHSPTVHPPLLSPLRRIVAPCNIDIFAEINVSRQKPCNYGYNNGILQCICRVVILNTSLWLVDYRFRCSNLVEYQFAIYRTFYRWFQNEFYIQRRVDSRVQGPSN